jgi:cellulose synthase operon protein YhjU
MGLWNLYFITKLYLHFGHYMGFHVWLNLVFALFLLLPLPGRYARLKPVRLALAIPAGILLFYHDTWLPPLSRALSQSSQLEGFTFHYLLELVGRFFNPLVVAGLLLLVVFYFLARKKLRITSFVMVAILVPMFSTGEQPPVAEAQVAAAPDNASAAPTSVNLTAQLNAFYQNESGRSVSFLPPAKTDAPFDIIFLQICSLSWDDVDFTKLRDNPLFKRFDIVFTDFNSAASYSGPAAIRLLRGSCGQPRHKSLYDPPQAQCLTFDNLQKIGFTPELAMNHDGQYGGFLNDVRERGGLQATPFNTAGLPTYLQAFDGSPIHDDYAVLAQWWKQRLQSPNRRVALYYNTISLHDGDRYPGRSSGSMEIYPQRLSRLLDDIDRFFSLLQASGRKAVVILVGEHGASIRGDKMQIAGLREIPSPRITTVPVGIKLIGVPDHGGPLVVSQPTSYLAVSKLLSEFVAISPFGKSASALDDYLRDLPATDFVSENDDVVVMRRDNQYYIRSKDADWVNYDTAP